MLTKAVTAAEAQVLPQSFASADDRVSLRSTRPHFHKQYQAIVSLADD
jgi:hypothetical protein